MDTLNNSNASEVVTAWAVTLLLIISSLGVILASRLYRALPQHRPSKNARPHDEKGPSNQMSLQTTCTATIYLGSGGHSSEMLQLVSGLDITKYNLRHYVVGEDDNSSLEKVHRFELSREQSDITFAFNSGRMAGCAGVNTRAQHPGANSVLSGYTVHRIPRSRYLHQSFLTTPFTLTRSLLVAITLIRQLACLPEKTLGRNQAQKTVLLMNGPGTCLSLVLAVIGLRMLGAVDDARTPDMVFVESFARVQTLSLTGRLLYPLCDTFVVQWPSLQTRYPRARCAGTLV